jgi:hypothetical protein
MLKVSENRDLKGWKCWEAGEDCRMRGFILCMLQEILLW